MVLARVGSVAAAIMFALAGCRSPVAHRPLEVSLDSLAATHTCTHSALIVDGGTDGLSVAARCGLVEQAIHSLASAAFPIEGVVPSDTALIDSARVYTFAFTDTSGQPAEKYWTVTLFMGTRPFDLSMRVDAIGGKMTFAKTGRGA